MIGGVLLNNMFELFFTVFQLHKYQQGDKLTVTTSASCPRRMFPLFTETLKTKIYGEAVGGSTVSKYWENKCCSYWQIHKAVYGYSLSLFY